MALGTWMCLMRRGIQLVCRGRQANVFKSSRYREWSSASRSEKGRSRSNVLLYGAVAFVWERERISNQDVMSCVREYAERVDRKLDLKDESPSTSVFPPVSSSDHTPSTSPQDPTSTTHARLSSWIHTAPNPSGTPAESAHFSKADSANSRRSSSGLLSLFYSGSDRSSSVRGPSHSEPSTWSAKISALFSQDAPVTSSSMKGGSSPSVSSANPSQSGWMAWAQGWFAVEQPPTDPKADVHMQRTDSGETPSHGKPEVDSEREMEERRREQFREECLRYYRAHSEERKSHLPLVGIAGAATPMRQGMQALEKAKDKTREKMIRFLSHHHSFLAAEELDGGPAGHADEGGLPPSLADLACIEVSFDAPWYQTAPSLRTGNWVGHYMSVDRLDKSDDKATPPTAVLDTLEPYKDHAVLLKAEKAVQPFIDGVKLLVSLGQHHFKDQLHLEGAFCFDDQNWTETVREALLDARSTARAVWSEVLQCYAAGSGMVTRQSGGTGGGVIIQQNGGTGGGVVIQQSGGTGGGVATQQSGVNFGGALEGSVKDFIPCQQPIPTSEENPGRTGPVWDWEFITADKNYTAYRKPYKGTGLYQYKVIGHYDDVTAKDFCEAQVDQEFRKTWDEYAGDIVMVDRDPESNTKLLHWIMKYPFPMSNREYLFVQRSWVSEDKEAIVIFNRAASHPDFPDTGKCVRVSDYFSKMVIKSRSRVEELGLDFELTYFDDAKTSLPSSCVNWVAYTAMPDFMGKIHTAALSRQKEKGHEK